MKTNHPVQGRIPESGFLRQSQIVPAIYPVSSATLWREVKAGNFPKPVKLGPRVTAWRAQDVRAWMDKQGGAQ